jgi:hypothetical protein
MRRRRSFFWREEGGCDVTGVESGEALEDAPLKEREVAISTKLRSC